MKNLGPDKAELVTIGFPMVWGGRSADLAVTYFRRVQLTSCRFLSKQSINYDLHPHTTISKNSNTSGTDDTSTNVVIEVNTTLLLHISISVKFPLASVYDI